MPALTYFTVTQVDRSIDEQLTMLATGDDANDVHDLRHQATKLGWQDILIHKCVSDTCADSPQAEDGKDKFRHHRRLWVQAHP